MPVNYAAFAPSINPLQMALQGYKAGSAVKLQQTQQAALDAKLQEQQQLHDDLAKFSQIKNPGAMDYASIMAKYPTLADHFKQSFDVLNSGQQDNAKKSALNVFAALTGGQTDIAKKMLEDQAAAAKNSGDQRGYDAASALVQLVDTNPDAARTSAGLMLSATMGPKQFAKVYDSLQSNQRQNELQGAAVTKANAEANAAAVKSGYAESNAVADLAKKGWDIKQIANDIDVKKQNVKIAAMNAKANTAKNDIERQKLQQQIETAKIKRDQTLRDKTAAVESANLRTDNAINTIDRLLSNPELNNVLGPVEGSKFYPTTIVSMLAPGADTEKRINALEDVKTVESQAFINNLMEAKQNGATFGALTDQEGQRLTGYIQSLSTRLSEDRFRKNMKEIQRLLLKSRENLANKYGVPQSVPDTPEAATSTAPNEIDALVKKYGGG